MKKKQYQKQYRKLFRKRFREQSRRLLSCAFRSTMSSRQKRTKLKIILLGNSGVGKTSLTKRYIGEEFKRLHMNTVGMDFTNKELCVDKEQVTLQIWDTAGQERFHSITSGFYRDANCCVLVYDVNILESFESLDIWHAQFVEEADPITPDKFRIPFVLMGNKTDVKGRTSPVVEKEKAVQWCETKGEIAYFETSAKEKSNVDEAFMEVARKALLYVRRTTKM
ncbi:predicted protein [Arabidopsis lyrata subsp. lyrata]|uniref:Ras-related protein Rab-7b n=1 Tax=Arabidopsis lyrata subsp. lyrata TaxID=81972 RepID=D7MJK0_ARALL|nr:predicted protein [Arabidopsis lyrata subsp. lyrata]